mmetsp:Transcript_19764/g.29546  ORF Transcript_19764/g.29546 Transcript_19764/m.29546 type:complete len:722 (+) Transcript_19764:208-2373(+)|eukprot:CAMPEP_0167752676 /NCGR_PEP_ID=MMETSP0110_2-20121227/7272_1 /TAXON_ID=629695 /ORGANISM="Gymnochlora sp., Strain CCMP2014" /LENGTH=721 /DNA_ID=CAMNT_0007638321 /DNA_START=197 /DNA_END=2362 /DNA_ORIENTATION=-
MLGGLPILRVKKSEKETKEEKKYKKFELKELKESAERFGPTCAALSSMIYIDDDLERKDGDKPPFTFSDEEKALHDSQKLPEEFKTWENTKPGGENLVHWQIKQQVEEDSGNSIFYVVFRGSQELVDWAINIAAGVTMRNGIKVHAGMNSALHCGRQNTPMTIFNCLKEALKNQKEVKDPTLVITGHSLGGGYALLTAAEYFASDEYEELRNLFEYRIFVNTFAAPQVIALPYVREPKWRKSYKKNDHEFISNTDCLADKKFENPLAEKKSRTTELKSNGSSTSSVLTSGTAASDRKKLPSRERKDLLSSASSAAPVLPVFNREEYRWTKSKFVDWFHYMEKNTCQFIFQDDPVPRLATASWVLFVLPATLKSFRRETYLATVYDWISSFNFLRKEERDSKGYIQSSLPMVALIQRVQGWINRLARRHSELYFEYTPIGDQIILHSLNEDRKRIFAHRVSKFKTCEGIRNFLIKEFKIKTDQLRSRMKQDLVEWLVDHYKLLSIDQLRDSSKLRQYSSQLKEKNLWKSSRGEVIGFFPSVLSMDIFKQHSMRYYSRALMLCKDGRAFAFEKESKIREIKKSMDEKKSIGETVTVCRGVPVMVRFLVSRKSMQTLRIRVKSETWMGRTSIEGNILVFQKQQYDKPKPEHINYIKQQFYVDSFYNFSYTSPDFNVHKGYEIIVQLQTYDSHLVLASEVLRVLPQVERTVQVIVESRPTSFKEV